MADDASEADRNATELFPGVFARQLGHGERLHGVAVTIDPDATAEAHSHPHEQLSVVTAGEIVMTVDGEDHRLVEGESIVIPGDVTHSATNDGAERAGVIDVFSPPREGLLD